MRGISKLADFYPKADFVISSVFNSEEASAFLAAYSETVAPAQARGAKELYSVIESRETVYFAHQRHTVLEANANGKKIRVTALSPTQAAFAQSIAHFAQYVPTKPDATQINHAPELKPNLEAVVLHIDFDGDAALLGSDLEDHGALGWYAVVNDSWCAARQQGTAYKVAHHGSVTGHHDGIWSSLLSPGPVAVLTPYSLAGQRLPTDEDAARIKSTASASFISSNASRRPDMDATVLKRLSDIATKITRVNSRFGAIRLRKRLGATAWTSELFGAASPL